MRYGGVVGNRKLAWSKGSLAGFESFSNPTNPYPTPPPCPLILLNHVLYHKVLPEPILQVFSGTRSITEVSCGGREGRWKGASSSAGSGGIGG